MNWPNAGLGPDGPPLHNAVIYGTIVPMKDSRPRLSEDDLLLILAALRARAAMSGPMRRHRIERLAERLNENVRGNPKWIHSWYSQTHEDELEDNEEES